MKLSVLLPLIGYTDFTIKDEKEFDFLSLVANTLDFPCCVFVDALTYVNNVPENATMVLTTDALAEQLSRKNYGICVLDEPRLAYFKLHNHLSKSDGYKRGSFITTIGERCQISHMSSIAENNVAIGNDVIIEEFSVIRENSTIGDRSIIRAGSVIGGHCTELKRDGEGMLVAEHLGGVIIGCDVEIQQLSCVNRAVYPWDNTIIGDYTKIGSLVLISHAVTIGRSVMVLNGSNISGNTVIMDGATIGLGATVSNRLEIGKASKVSIGAVATKSVADNERVSGNFAINHEKYVSFIKSIR